MSTLTARAADAAGNVSGASAGLVITIDTVGGGDTLAPVLQSFSSSTANGAYGPGAVINITATFDEALRADSTMTVQLDNGRTVVLSVVVGAVLSGSYTVGATGSGEDSGDLTVASITSALVYDAAGNEQTGTTLPASNVGDTSDIAIDTTVPAQPTIDSVTTDTGQSANDEITSDTTLILTGAAAADSAVEITLTGTGVIGSVVADGSGHWAFDYTGTSLSDGAHGFTATATDPVGNVSPSSAEFVVTVDTVSPAAPTGLDLIASSDTGTSSSDDITSDDTPTITGSAESGSLVTLYDTDGTTVLGTATANGSGNWSITSSVLADGEHTLTARAADAAGNVSGASAGLVITIDTVGGGDTLAPVLQSFSSSTANGAYGPGAVINITATFDEALRADSTMTVQLDNGRTVVLSVVVGAVLSGSYTVGATGSGEDSGDLTVASITSALVYDAAGNEQTGRPYRRAMSATPATSPSIPQPQGSRRFTWIRRRTAGVPTRTALRMTARQPCRVWRKRRPL